MILHSSRSGLASLMSLGDLGDATTGLIAEGGGVTSVLAALPFAAAACPLCAPLIALGAALTGLFGQIFSGCGQTCTLSSDDANKVEQIFQQNVSTYQSGQHTYDEQQTALQVFDYGWAQLASTQMCGNPALGTAGRNCIAERQRGGCAAWQCNAPGTTKGSNGQCCGADWFALYRDPIANDPHVQPMSAPASSSTSSFSSNDGTSTGVGLSTGLTPNILLWGAGGLALILLLTAGKGN